jgi:heme/copper-type cytochrome/quinol oxidase subunit 3
MIPDHVFGALVFVFVEIMFYSSLLSSFLVMRRGRDSWGQEDFRALPVAGEGFNGLILALAAGSVVLAARSMSRGSTQARGHLFRATGLSAMFLMFQLALGWKLYAAGVTLTSSVFAGCLYVILGSHLLQAAIGTAWLARIKPSGAGHLRGLAVFWCFLFAIWPIMYGVLFF